MRNSYLKDYQEAIKNKVQYETKEQYKGGKGCGEGVKLELIPGGVCKVPFVYKDELTGSNYNMFFCGGVTCCVYDNGVLEPK